MQLQSVRLMIEIDLDQAQREGNSTAYLCEAFESGVELIAFNKLSFQFASAARAKDMDSERMLNH